MSDWSACVRRVGRKAGCALTLTAVLAACGSTTVIEHKTETATATATAEPTNTTNEQSPAPTPPSPVAPLPNRCSSGLSTSHAISCELAGNVFYEYHKAVQRGADTTGLSAWSPATKKYYTADCSKVASVISCRLSGTTEADAEVQITQAALDAYTPRHASEYARTHELGPNG